MKQAIISLLISLLLLSVHKPIECGQSHITYRYETFNEVWDEYIDNIYSTHEKRRYPYVAPEGNTTIGIGHIVYEDRFIYPLSDSTIRALLEEDMDNFKDKVLHIHPELDGYKLIAITDLVATLGRGGYNRTSLRKLIQLDPNSKHIPNKIRQFHWYKKPNGEWIESANLKRKMNKLASTYFKQYKLVWQQKLL